MGKDSGGTEGIPTRSPHCWRACWVPTQCMKCAAEAVTVGRAPAPQFLQVTRKAVYFFGTEIVIFRYFMPPVWSPCR
jgi:hypothetical protein